MQPSLCKNQSPEKVAARMRHAIDMHRAGVRMARAQIEHEYPYASPEVVRQHLNRWLRSPTSQPVISRRP